MNYFKDENNNVFAYDDGQVKKGYSKDLISITDDEKKHILSPSLKDAKVVQKNIIKVSFTNELKRFNTSYNIVMQCDERDVLLLDKGISYIERKGLTAITIRDADDKDHVMTIEESKKLLEEMEDNYFYQREKKNTLIKEIDSKLKVSTVESIVW